VPGQLPQSAGTFPDSAAYRTEFRHWLSAFGDNNGVPLRSLLNKARELGLGRPMADRFRLDRSGPGSGANRRLSLRLHGVGAMQ
jgi:hypothetical protein